MNTLGSDTETEFLETNYLGLECIFIFFLFRIKACIKVINNVGLSRLSIALS
jgi:hypothetical protein